MMAILVKVGSFKTKQYNRLELGKLLFGDKIVHIKFVG